MTDKKTTYAPLDIAAEALHGIPHPPSMLYTAVDLASAILKARKLGSYDRFGESRYNPENSPQGIAEKINVAAVAQQNAELPPEVVAKIAELAENEPA